MIAANGATLAEVRSGDLLYQASLSGHVVRLAVASTRRAVPGLRLAATTLRGFDVEPGFSLLAPLSTADANVVDDATPLDDDTVHSAVLFKVGADTVTILAQVAATASADIHVSPSGLPAASSSPRPACTREAAWPGCANGWASNSATWWPSAMGPTIMRC